MQNIIDKKKSCSYLENPEDPWTFFFFWVIKESNRRPNFRQPVSGTSIEPVVVMRGIDGRRMAYKKFIFRATFTYALPGRNT